MQNLLFYLHFFQLSSTEVYCSLYIIYLRSGYIAKQICRILLRGFFIFSGDFISSLETKLLYPSFLIHPVRKKKSIGNSHKWGYFVWIFGEYKRLRSNASRWICPRERERKREKAKKRWRELNGLREYLAGASSIITRISCNHRPETVPRTGSELSLNRSSQNFAQLIQRNPVFIHYIFIST